MRFWLASAGDEVSEWRHREGDAVTRVCAKKTAEAHAVSGFGSGCRYQRKNDTRRVPPSPKALAGQRPSSLASIASSLVTVFRLRPVPVFEKGSFSLLVPWPCG